MREQQHTLKKEMYDNVLILYAHAAGACNVIDEYIYMRDTTKADSRVKLD